MSSELHEEIERGEQGGRVHRAVLRLRAVSERHPVLRVLHKGIVIVLGAVLGLAGLVMLVTPGPGWLFIFLGLGVWSTEFEWAHRLNLRIKRAALRVWRWWSNLVAERRHRRARDRPHRLVQGPRHMRAPAPGTTA
ncbi:PGPGW domain-containing protein [Kocuria sp.]|uniref:PGPGW domain-containing protein n=1 Tax=Kocuria sp. TaxID=1871328 RepID=UPI0026DB17E1|nr:PGPGW domain-containing protein [Kocuria sp.]MDO4920153.1 PGPGW domain-containing protein [Kocuria sp.]